MTQKKAIFLILLFLIFSNLTYSKTKETTPLQSDKTILNKVKTKRKPLNKKIVYLMIAGLIIPLGAGYYVVKKK